MKDILTLVKLKHGSHLYGTSTPISDDDFKGVHIPSGRDIILQRVKGVQNYNVKLSDTIKNQAGDIDYESFALQKYLNMLVDGDTVATEVLFAPPENFVEVHPQWAEIQSFGKSLINRQCKGFVGYCVRQAAKYGVKGSRMNAVKKLLDLLECTLAMDTVNTSTKLSFIEDTLKEFALEEEHASFINIPSPGGAELWHIECCDRKMPMTASIHEAYKVFSKVWENYGERARQAMTNQGIDWKAVSHAVRVARQAIELLTTGSITFPRPDATELLAIKQGKLPYGEVSAMLEDLIQEVERVSLTSTLPEASNKAFLDDVVLGFYLEQVNG